MKKTICIVLLVLLCSFASLSFAQADPTPVPPIFVDWVQQQAKTYFVDYDSVSLIENYGTDDPTDYIATVRYKKGYLSDENKILNMIKSLSDDLATKTYKMYDRISEIAIMWEIENAYTGKARNVRYTYSRQSGGMLLIDKFE